MFSGTVNVGGVVSFTVMVWTNTVVLSQPSAKVQVLVITDSLAQVPSSTVSVKVASRPESQLSFSSVTSPVIDKSLTSTSHSTVISSGTVKVGAVSSRILMVCIKVVVLSQVSVNDHVRVMTRAPAQFPSAVLSENVASRPDAQLSISSVTSPVIVKSLGSLPHSIVISAGTVKVGATESTTLIVCIKDVVLSQASVKDQVRSITDALRQLPSVTAST